MDETRTTTIVPEETTNIQTEPRKDEENKKKDPMWWTVLTWMVWVIKWIAIIVAVMAFGTMAVFIIPSMM